MSDIDLSLPNENFLQPIFRLGQKCCCCQVDLAELKLMRITKQSERIMLGYLTKCGGITKEILNAANEAGLSIIGSLMGFFHKS